MRRPFDARRRPGSFNGQPFKNQSCNLIWLFLQRRRTSEDLESYLPGIVHVIFMETSVSEIHGARGLVFDIPQSTRPCSWRLPPEILESLYATARSCGPLEILSHWVPSSNGRHLLPEDHLEPQQQPR